MHEPWREGVGTSPRELEPHLEAAVLTRLRQAVHQKRQCLWLVLGEPGSGKTSLLEEWFRRWAADLGNPRLGLSVPVLVRLRSLTAEDAGCNSETLGDRLWHRAVEEHALVGGFAQAIYLTGAARLFQPVWLLDGLDEAPTLGPDLPRKLAALPGVKLLTCRSAVFQSLRESVAGYVEHQAEYEVLPLTSKQQADFLTRRLESRARAEALSQQIMDNPQLAALAGNPLMLNLIAEVAGSGPANAPFLGSRAAFYQRAVERIWTRKLGPGAPAELRRHRDPVLTELAHRMELKVIEAETAVLDKAVMATPGAAPDIENALRKSGLLVVDDDSGKARFFHLTFQEFYLARGLERDGLQAALQQHWHEARYAETLALLLSRFAEAGRTAEIEAALDWLIVWGRQAHRRDPVAFWRQGRSPLRVSLHLLRRAGIGPSALGDMAGRLESVVRTSRLMGVAVAADQLMPSFLLAALVRDEDAYVRRAAAGNSATPPEALAALVRDEDALVRWEVAGNSAMPPEALADLARDEEANVRRRAAWNSAMPPEELAALARDEDADVRRWVAGNSAMPPEALAALARDKEADVRYEAAQNSAMPLEALAALARDGEAYVRGGAAGNSAMPPEALAALVRDEEAYVRGGAAAHSAMPPEGLVTLMLAGLVRDGEAYVRRKVVGNSATPPEVLTALARDENAEVRHEATGNSAMPPEVLAALARDEEVKVRWGAAENSATPPEALAALARDQDAHVRGATAANSTTPPEALAALAQDEDANVRGDAAWNSRTPPEALPALAQDEDAHVRRWVAGRRAAPPEVLAALARDEDADVRRGAAENSVTPPEVLAALARDEDADVRRAAAGNSATPPEALAALARDKDVNVRRDAARNSVIFLEDLIGGGGWMLQFARVRALFRTLLRHPR